MDYEVTLEKLRQNSEDAVNEAVRLLLKIAENILQNPNNVKLRTLQKSNALISNKILSVQGGSECLQLMGFKENTTSFTMPMNASLDTINEFKDIINSWKTSISATDNEELKVERQSKTDHAVCEVDRIKPVILPPLVYTYNNPFLRRMEMYAHHVLQHEDKVLQARCRKLIPAGYLEYRAQEHLRDIQLEVKKRKLDDPNISLQDVMILELLSWFKNDFFTWIDSPGCEHCGGECSYSHMSTDPKLLVFTDRVELHRCKSCHQFTPFPRYNDLNILLETRRGRCGEWANTFTLCCRSLGWDVRFVIEEHDHVWTEVYSVTQKRWLHCDPCENICDTPLIYESGWNKKISYVLAYSAEEVQDVTWRYSSNHKEVLRRRKNCTEQELLDAMFSIREKKQKCLSEARKKFLTRRTLMELVELMVEKKPNEGEKKGRTSGSNVWRLLRGETQEEQTSYVWSVHSSDLNDQKTFSVNYYSTSDKYVSKYGETFSKELNGWALGAYRHQGVFRKVEQDWKMVYISRKAGEEKGSISWKLDLKDCDRVIDKLTLVFDYKTYETGTVSVTVCSKKTCYSLPKGEKLMTLDGVGDIEELTVTAVLAGGKGDVAWQHAQLFRQSLHSSECGFSILLQFK